MRLSSHGATPKDSGKVLQVSTTQVCPSHLLRLSFFGSPFRWHPGATQVTFGYCGPLHGANSPWQLVLLSSIITLKLSTRMIISFFLDCQETWRRVRESNPRPTLTLLEDMRRVLCRSCPRSRDVSFHYDELRIWPQVEPLGFT